MKDTLSITAEMTNSNRDISVSNLVHSLPPVSSNEWKAIQDSLQTLDISVPDDVLRQYEATRCMNNATNDKDTPLKKSVQAKLSEYQDTVYGAKGLDAKMTLQHEDENNQNILTVRTYVEQLDGSNCRAGSFSCKWIIETDPNTEREAQVSGEAAMHLYYFENGSNQQLRATRSFEPQVASTSEEKVNAIVARMEERNMSYEDKVAKAICVGIEKRELELYQQLQEMSVELQDKLRKLRRILPVTKTRFKWNAAAQKQVTLLNDARPPLGRLSIRSTSRKNP